MGWYTDNLGDTAENRARDGMSVSENFANSAANGGLSGYALDYASVRGTGGSDSDAHSYAASNSGTGTYVPSRQNVDSRSSRIFFPDQSKYLDATEWLKSGLSHNSLNDNSYMGAARANAQLQTYNHYRLDENGNIIKTQASDNLSSLKAASPSADPETGINNNNYFNGQGYAYTDKYGLPHVVNDYATAQEYARDTSGPKVNWTSLGGENYQVYANPGEVSSYQGSYGGGYALGDGGSRVFIPMPGAVAYGNEGSAGKQQASSNASSASPTTDLSTNLNADRARALANMLQSRTTAQTATDTDYDAMLRQSQGANYNNLTPEEKATIIKMMKVLSGRGGA